MDIWIWANVSIVLFCLKCSILSLYFKNIPQSFTDIFGKELAICTEVNMFGILTRYRRIVTIFAQEMAYLRALFAQSFTTITLLVPDLRDIIYILDKTQIKLKKCIYGDSLHQMQVEISRVIPRR